MGKERDSGRERVARKSSLQYRVSWFLLSVPRFCALSIAATLRSGLQIECPGAYNWAGPASNIRVAEKVSLAGARKNNSGA